MTRVLRIARGDLSLWAADALAISANRSLSGNANPMHWRFAGRKSCDGAVLAAGGAELAANVAALNPQPPQLAQGSAIATRAGGALSAQWVVHASAPDALYGGSDPEQAESMLSTTHNSILSVAHSVGAQTLACCAIGCGVMGFRPAVAARATLSVASRWLASKDEYEGSSLRELTFVLFADDVWRAWPLIAEKHLGPAHAVRRNENAQVSKLSWTA